MSLYYESRARYGSMPANIIGMKIDITPYIPQRIWSEFLRSGKLTVAIDPMQQELSRYANVLITRVQLELVGLHGEQPNRIQATLTHEGRALIYDRSGNSHTFSHVPVSVPFEMEDGRLIVDGNVATGTNDYEGLTPYGPWSINIDTTRMDHGFLARMKGIQLVFDGKARGRP